MLAHREVLALEVSGLLRRQPRVVEERVDLVGESFLTDRDIRDLRIPVQPGAHVRVDVGTAHSELSDFSAKPIRGGDHRHEFVVWNHEVERTDVRCLMEDGLPVAPATAILVGACMMLPPRLVMCQEDERGNAQRTRRDSEALQSVVELGESLLEEPALGIRVNQLEGTFIGDAGFVHAVEP